MQHLYPLFLDITQYRCLIVGGGAVAARKARGLLDAGATDIRVVSPTFSADLPQELTRIPRPFTSSDLDGINLCFAATDQPDINTQVVQACQTRGILVNRADRDDTDTAGTFTVPAIHRQGPLTIAVSASGSPAIAAAIRNDIASHLDPTWPPFATCALTLRTRILSLPHLTPSQRQSILRTLSSAPAMTAYKQQGEHGLTHYLHEHHPELQETT